MAFQTILFDIEGGVGRLRLNIPHKINALSRTLLTEMLQVLEHVQDQDVRCLLVSGEGRGFCSGADLTDGLSTNGTSPDLKQILDQYYHPVIERLHALPLPVIMAVNGVCAGAGTALALAGDLVLAEVSTRFSLGFVKIGLMPDAGSTWSLPRRVGSTRAFELSLLGEEISGATALEWGLINRAYADGTLQDEAQKLAKQLASGPTLAYGLTKQALKTCFQSSLTDQLEVEASAQQIAGRSADFVAGVAGFLTKKSPEFQGR